MKFETPIADIRKFDLKDVISASGEDPRPSRYDTVYEGNCTGGAPDNGDTDCA